MGRIRLPVARKRSELVGLRLTKDERRRFAMAAAQSGKKLTAWLRDAALAQAAILETATRTA